MEIFAQIHLALDLTLERFKILLLDTGCVWEITESFLNSEVKRFLCIESGIAKTPTGNPSFAFYIGKCYITRTMEVAVIKTGGKQYVVSKGDTIAIEKLPGDLKKGDTVVFGEVLLVDNGSDTTIGAPVIKGAEVKGTVVLAGLGKKVEVVKYKPKSRYYKRKGHRQPLLKVKIDSIS